MNRELTPKQRVNRAEWKILSYGTAIIILVLILLGAARGEEPASTGFTLTAEGPTHGLSVNFRSAAELLEFMNKRRLLVGELPIEDTTGRSGAIFVRIEGATADVVRGKNITLVVIADDGTVAKRETGSQDNLDLEGGVWSNSVYFDLPALTEQLRFRLVRVIEGEAVDYVLGRAKPPESPAPFEPVAAGPSQRQAAARYPALKVVGSPLHREFVRRFEAYKRGRHSLLLRPDWPLQIADEAQTVLNNNGSDFLLPSAASR